MISVAPVTMMRASGTTKQEVDMFKRHHEAMAAGLDAAVVTADRAPRLSGSALRTSLERFCPPVTIQLRPGERTIGGRVFYSAAWLSPPHAVAPREHRSSFGVEHGRLEGVPIDVDPPSPARRPSSWAPPTRRAAG